MYFGIAVLVFMVIGGLIARRYEKKTWNNGTCSMCGSEWKQFDRDSQGGRGYVCSCRHTWISYGVD